MTDNDVPKVQDHAVLLYEDILAPNPLHHLFHKFNNFHLFHLMSIDLVSNTLSQPEH